MPTTNEAAKHGTPRRFTRRRIGCLLLLGLVIVLVVNEWLVRPLINPLLRSDSEIAANLLERTPIGSSRSELTAFVKAQGLWPGADYGWMDTGRREDQCEQLLGSYWSFGFTVCVYADWFFGPDGRLQRVEVWRMVVDGL